MLLVSLVATLCLSMSCAADYTKLIPKTRKKELEQDDNTTLCVMNIMLQYYSGVGKLTYINLNEHDDDFLQNINQWMKLTISLRSLPVTFTRINKSYLIVARNEDIFSRVLWVRRDFYWNPYAKFTVVIFELDKNKLRKIFDVLLKLHVNDVVVVNGTQTAELYTYNPFEDYACGRYYSRIIEYGKCDAVGDNLYPNKLITGFRKCNFRLSLPHWPPFSINPKKVPRGIRTDGVEEEVFKMLSVVEKFNYSSKFNYDAQSFTVITDSISIKGPLAMLEDNVTDVMMGAIILTGTRAKTFSFLHGYMDFMDELVIFVKKSLEVPPWFDCYFNFSSTLWALLFLTYVTYSFFMLVLLNPVNFQGRIRILMILFCNMLNAGANIRNRSAVNVVFILWVWFSWLINSFYTSSLFSSITKPGRMYQVQTEHDLELHGMEPCLWNAMHGFLSGENSFKVGIQNQSHECYWLNNSMRLIAQSPKRFGFFPLLQFRYHMRTFFDIYGDNPYYQFKNPYSKLMYAIYMYKGFPNPQRLQSVVLRIRETGLVDKIIADIMTAKKLKFHFQKKAFHTRFAVPWRVYAAGVILSILVLLFELAMQYNKKAAIVSLEENTRNSVTKIET